ncbi:MAG TPA: hypothetical protein DEA90_06310 [Opitutae bacterium]|nr:hypothetical protein [Opitutae bacterium]
MKDKLDSMERSHPRLLLTDEAVEDMRARVASDSELAKLALTSRDLIRGALIQKAMEASLIKDYWWVGSSNNWNQVCRGAFEWWGYGF